MNARLDVPFRYAGLVACAMVGLPPLAERLATQAGAGDRFLIFVHCVLLAVFAVLFWINTRPSHVRNPRRRNLALLLVQVLVGAQLNLESLYIVAAEAGFVLRRRTGLIWMAVQSAAFLLVAVLALVVGDFEPIDGVKHVSPAVAWILTVFSMLTWAGFAYFAGLLSSTEMRDRQELVQANAELRGTRQLLADTSRLSERLKISRELHDSLGHHLTGLSLHLQLAARLAQGDAAEPVQKAHLVARLMLNDLRDAVASLRHGHGLDLKSALNELVAAVPGIAVRLRAGDLDVPDPAQAHAIFRAVQEIVTNAAKHSGAEFLEIDLEQSADGLQLAAKDQGRGCAAVKAGNGLKGMRERIEELGGRVEIETAPGQGFKVFVWLPGAEETA